MIPGFTIVTAGNHKNELNGAAALAMFPHVEDVANRFSGKERKVGFSPLTASHHGVAPKLLCM
jgi:hypothetical protein